MSLCGMNAKTPDLLVPRVVMPPGLMLSVYYLLMSISRSAFIIINSAIHHGLSVCLMQKQGI